MHRQQIPSGHKPVRARGTRLPALGGDVTAFSNLRERPAARPTHVGRTARVIVANVQLTTSKPAHRRTNPITRAAGLW